ncbi:MAG: hypothetical protein Q9212_005424, partial [Teloschistes hypoglaucus]
MNIFYPSKPSSSFPGGTFMSEDDPQTTKNPFPSSLSYLILPPASRDLSKALHNLKSSTISITNRLSSIHHDSVFVQQVANHYSLPIIANERCGSWYIPPGLKAGSAYFKSTDGHMREWGFSSRRLNLQLLDIVGRHGGCIIVDSTRRGKSMPDALSKTIPIWCTVMNRLVFEEWPRDFPLYTPDAVVSRSEHSQIEARIPALVEEAKLLDLPLSILRHRLKKPLRPSWVTPDIPFPGLPSPNNDKSYTPIICTTSSHRVHGAENSENGYIQGAGDDSEGWSRGLTPSLFWAHEEGLRNTNEEELPGYIQKLLREQEHRMMVGGSKGGRATLIHPTKTIYIGPLACINDPGEWDAIIVCNSTNPFATSAPSPSSPPPTKERPKPQILHLPTPAGKLGSRALRRHLRLIPPFLDSVLPFPHITPQTISSPAAATQKILFTCPTGHDLSVGAALVCLCLFFTDNGSPSKNSDTIDKVFIRRRLAWIIANSEDANPARETLQAVNAFLMGRTEDIHHDHLETVQIPHNFISSIEKPNDPQGGSGSSAKTSRKESSSDIAFLFHTSGTSSGLPKPILQTQHGVIGVLPFRLDGHESATFTTTPLYHGGISDCFRAWTSNALVWLFPGKDVPITPTNVLKCFGCTKSAEKGLDTPPVKYFSSVPYILQMVAAEAEGMKMLQSMDMVGVGGAALPQETGDELVQEGVNLVSRFGSAECGFLLSSHRDYERDKDWHYLRNQSLDLLKFEPQDDESGLSELVIQYNWPHMAKRNREDGSFATADLLAPHPTIRNAWRYHSRADSQLTLITGKKFDPAPLEAAIAATSLLSDVLIFGNGMQQPGALLFRSDAAKEMTERDLLNQLWPVVESLNKQGQAHTRIARSMLLVMPAEAPGLEKSSKGTVLRGQAEKKYEKNIQGAYEHRDDSANGNHGRGGDVVPDHEVPTTVLEIIKDVTGISDPIPEEADLFSFGVDSVACMAIRARLQSRIVDAEAPALPLNVVYDCGNIKRLSRYLIDVRKGKVTESEDEIQLMRDLVEQYSKFSCPSMNLPEANVNIENPISTNEALSSEDEGEHVILTGATGSLGAHILHLLRFSPSILPSHKISSITCLVRAASSLAAHERVSKSLIARAKPGLPPFDSSSSSENITNGDSSRSGPRVDCVPCTLSSPTLGLEPTTYLHLARKTTLIIHAAWAVNFTARLRSFVKDHIGGLKNLLDFTISPSSSSSLEEQQEDAPQQQSRKKDGNNKKNSLFLFLSSTASVTSTPPHHQPFAEHMGDNPTDASPLGYSRSKWVAENICARFHTHIHTCPHQQSTPKIDIAILRIGQLTGDTESGIWNMSEAYPLMLSTAPLLRALPDLPNTPLDWLPVDIAAKAIIEIAKIPVTPPNPFPQTQNTTTPSSSGPPTTPASCPVLHILNPSTEPTWRDLLQTIKQQAPDLNIRTLPPAEWLEALRETTTDMQAKKL